MRKDDTASVISFVCSIAPLVRDMLSNPSRYSFSSAFLNVCFIVYMATGLFEAITFAVSSNAAYSFALSSRTLETNPIQRASSDFMYRPVQDSSLKTDWLPTSLGKSWRVPRSAAIPISTSFMVNCLHIFKDTHLQYNSEYHQCMKGRPLLLHSGYESQQ